MRATRAYLAGLGTAGSLLAGAALLFVLASAVISFRGWPALGVPSTPPTAVLTLHSAPGSATARRLVAAVDATRRAVAGAGDRRSARPAVAPAGGRRSVAAGRPGGGNAVGSSGAAGSRPCAACGASGLAGTGGVGRGAGSLAGSASRHVQSTGSRVTARAGQFAGRVPALADPGDGAVSGALGGLSQTR